MFEGTYTTYATIDDLWDTLHGTIRKYDDKLALEIINRGYHYRRTNVLSRYHPDIDDDEIAKLWNARDFDTFKLSLTTNIFNQLSMHGFENSILEKDHPMKKELVLVLNTYPYNLTKSFLRSLVGLIKPELKYDKILRIHMAPYEITNEYIKEKNINRFISHSLDFFLSHHIYNKTPNDCVPFVRVIAPFCFHKDLAHIESVDKSPIETINNQFHSLYRAWVDFEILPLHDFSLCPPDSQP